MSENDIQNLSKKALGKAEPLEGNGYKVILAQNLIKKLFLKLAA